MFYTVERIDEDNVVFEGDLILTLDFVAKYMRLSHCLTISSSQGRTLQGIVEIFTNHKRFTMKHLNDMPI